MKMRKAIALVMAVMMLFCLMPMGAVSAVADATSGLNVSDEPTYTEPTIVVPHLEVEAGAIIEVPVLLKNNPGIVSAKIKVEYDSNVLELLTYYNEDEETDMNMIVPGADYDDRWADANYTLGKCQLNFCHGTSKSKNYTGELFYTATFKVKENAVPGTYALTIVHDNKDFFNCVNDGEQQIDFAVSHGSVTVIEDTPDEPADGNLIVNGDFETGDASGWETWQSTTISADAAKDGAYGAHLVGNGGWGGLMNQTMTVVPGNEYKLSFWINVNAVGVNVQVKDGSGTKIEGAGGWFDGNKKDKLVEWSFTATDDKVFINFCGSGFAPEDVYVDNFSLICTGEAPADPSNDGYIINGDFETGALHPWNNLWGGCPTAEVIEGGKDSKYALNIVSKQWNHVRQTGIAVEANTDYKISVWAKNANNMCLLVKDSGDSTDLANVGVNAGAEWTQFTVEFNSGSYTSILFSLMGGEGSDQYGVFDNVVMEKGCQHEYDHACDADCNICGATREVKGHTYVGTVTTPADCVNTGVMTYTCSDCGDTYTKELAATGIHTYDNACDSDCNVCEAVRVAPHTYANACDRDCNLCGAVRVAPHVYDGDCDNTCNLCDAKRKSTADHVYSDDCDATCNVCYAVRTDLGHVYTDSCDHDCNNCGAFREPPHHYADKYDDECDTCGTWREIVIVYGDADGDDKITTMDAVLLSQFLAGWDVTLDMISGDADGDGAITTMDAVLLSQYLAGWNVQLG